MKFTAYSAKNGEVLFSGDADVPGALRTRDTLILEGVAHDGEGWIDAAGAFNPVPQKPTESHKWDWAARQWTDPRTLADHKAAKWAQIKRAREAEKVAKHMATPFGVVDADVAGVENLKATMAGLQAAMSLGATPGPMAWTMANDSVVELTPAELAQISVLLLARGNAAHVKARGLRTQIDAAATPAEVEAIGW
jgi:hypothetical protein